VRVLTVFITLVCVAVPVHALARPKTKIAVAPLKGDADGTVAAAVVDALAGKDFAVVPPGDVGREIKKLGLSNDLDAKTVRKLTASLEVVAIVDGTVRTSARKRSVHLEVHRRGKPTTGFTVEFKTTASATFHRGIHDQVAKRLGGAASRTADDEDEDDSDKPAAKRSDSDDAGSKRKPSDDDSDSKRKPSDDDTGSKPKPSEDDTRSKLKRKRSYDEPLLRKRKIRRGEAYAPAQALARASAGASIAQRQLTYETRSGFTQAPPRVVTTAGGGRVDGELYPFALADASSRFADLGLAASYDKTFGLSIKIPNRTVSAPIDQSHYAIGARYRFSIGQSSTIKLGIDYARRHYIADRSSLMAVVLDAPDVDYSAIAPGIAAHVPVTPTITAVAALDGMLMLETGPIQRTPSYGPATVYGIEALAGVDVALTPQIGLRVVLEYSRINLSFNGKGEMTTSRDNDVTTQDVNGATDRWIGVAATIGLVY
jgi:hypothetical protein